MAQWEAGGGDVRILPSFPFKHHENQHNKLTAARLVPMERRALTTTQNVLCAAVTSVVGSVLARPVVNLQHFYFLSLAPHEFARRQKFRRVFETIRTVNWMHGATPFSWQVSSTFGILSTASILADTIQNNFGDKTRNGIGTGFIAGALTGVGLTVFQHPRDVLRATAERETARNFKGAGDVFLTALQEKPAILLGLYRGVGVSALAATIQYGVIFSWYYASRDVTARTSMLTFLLSTYLSVVVGHALQYPVHYVRQDMMVLNATRRFGSLSLKQYFLEARKTIGVSVVFNGFFKSKPVINAAPLAMSIAMFDMSARWLGNR